MIKVKTGSCSTSHWSTDCIRLNGWLRAGFRVLILVLSPTTSHKSGESGTKASRFVDEAGKEDESVQIDKELLHDGSGVSRVFVRHSRSLRHSYIPGHVPLPPPWPSARTETRVRRSDRTPPSWCSVSQPPRPPHCSPRSTPTGERPCRRRRRPPPRLYAPTFGVAADRPEILCADVRAVAAHSRPAPSLPRPRPPAPPLALPRPPARSPTRIPACPPSPSASRARGNARRTW